jgi:hypothetical protein
VSLQLLPRSQWRGLTSANVLVKDRSDADDADDPDVDAIGASSSSTLGDDAHKRPTGAASEPTLHHWIHSTAAAITIITITTTTTTTTNNNNYYDYCSHHKRFVLLVFMAPVT